MKKGLCLLLALLCSSALAEKKPDWCLQYDKIIRLNCTPARYLVKDGAAYDLLDVDGTVLKDDYFDAMYDFKEGLAVVLRMPFKGSFIDESGELISDFVFYNGDWVGLREFSEGLCRVEGLDENGEYGNGKFGYINAQGEAVIQPRFDRAGDFHDGLARVVVNDRTGYIDTTGAWVVKPQHRAAGSFSNGRAWVKTAENRYGYIDTRGRMVIPAQFLDVEAFSEGLAAVKTEEGWGYIDADGEFVAEPQYRYCWAFEGGYAAVEESGGRCGLIDRQGRVVLPFEYDWIDLPEGVNLTPETFTVQTFKGETYQGEALRYFRFEEGRAIEVAGLEVDYQNPWSWKEGTAAERELVFLVEADNPVDSLTLEQLKAIYGGEITHWPQLGAPEQGEIRLFQSESRYIQEAFEELMRDIWLAQPLQFYDENDYFFYKENQPFRAIPGAIGVTTRGFYEALPREDMKILEIEGIMGGENT